MLARALGVADQTARQNTPLGVSACLLALSSLPLILTLAPLKPATARKQMLYCVSDSSPSRGPITRVVIRYPPWSIPWSIPKQAPFDTAQPGSVAPRPCP
ncbi:hypothetical protein D3C86_1493800 [compost metagenome]